MMVTTIQEVDIIKAYQHETGLGKVRMLIPLFGFVGYDNWQDAIVIWDDEGDLNPQPPYTNQDFIDWENDRLSIETQTETSKTNIQAARDAFDLSLQDYELIVQIESDLAGIFYTGGTPTIDQVFNAMVNRLSGTAIEAGVTNYVKTIGGVATLATNKATTVNVAIQYLRILKGAYETKFNP